MKWTRSKDTYKEYSNGYIDLRHYISMTHEKRFPVFYKYVYSVNGEAVLYGTVEANSWDEAEQIVVKRIHNKLRGNVVYWQEMFNKFDKELNASETIYSSSTSK